MRPKNTASDTFVGMPEEFAAEVKDWMESMEDQRPEAFLFALKSGATLDYSNFSHCNARARSWWRSRGTRRPRHTPPGYLTGVNL